MFYIPAGNSEHEFAESVLFPVITANSQSDICLPYVFKKNSDCEIRVLGRSSGRIS